MPQNRFQKFIFALITVVITVNLFVFYNVFHVEQHSYAFYGGKVIGIFLIVEFILAMTCELLVGSPCSAMLALRVVDPRKYPGFLVESAIICCTVCIMCPLMSFLAVFIYNGFTAYFLSPETFSMSGFWIHFIPNWFDKVCHNFPLALFSQMFFIQPLVRNIFGHIFYPKKKAA